MFDYNTAAVKVKKAVQTISKVPPEKHLHSFLLKIAQGASLTFIITVL